MIFACDRLADTGFDLRLRRTRLQPGAQGRNAVISTTRHHLDPAVRQVARITGNTELQRLFTGRCPEKHTLYVTGHPAAAAAHVNIALLLRYLRLFSVDVLLNGLTRYRAFLARHGLALRRDDIGRRQTEHRPQRSDRRRVHAQYRVTHEM